MGNCCSSGSPASSTTPASGGSARSAGRRRGSQATSSTELLETGNGQALPLADTVPPWQTDRPVTKREIHAKREEFWSTAPAFEGRQEVWDALRAACDTTDRTLAQAILSSAEIKLPQGLLSVAYDALGNRYEVPPYCFSYPTNMIDTDEEPPPQEQTRTGAPAAEAGSAKPAADSAQAAAPTAGSTTPPANAGEMFKLKVRVSIGQDFIFQFGKREPVARVKDLVVQETKLERNKLHVFFCGKLVHDRRSIEQLPFDAARDVLQVLVVSVENAS